MTVGSRPVPRMEVATGIKIPNVPQEVPVAKLIPQAIRKKIAGINAFARPLLARLPILVSTKACASR